MEKSMVKQEVSCKAFVSRKTVSLFLIVVLVCCMACSAFAAGTDTTVSYDDFSSVITKLTGQISVANIIAVIAGVAGACVGLVFMWWGVRKVVRMLMAAFKRGKISV